MITETRNEKILEIQYENANELVAHICCVIHQAKKELQIVDLFATKPYRDMNFEDMLLEEALLYAAENGIKRIVTYIGPEPYNPEPYRSVNEEQQWYQSYGFSHEFSVLGVTPCLVLDMEKTGVMTAPVFLFFFSFFLLTFF